MTSQNGGGPSSAIGSRSAPWNRCFRFSARRAATMQHGSTSLASQCSPSDVPDATTSGALI